MLTKDPMYWFDLLDMKVACPQYLPSTKANYANRRKYIAEAQKTFGHLPDCLPAQPAAYYYHDCKSSGGLITMYCYCKRSLVTSNINLLIVLHRPSVTYGEVPRERLRE